MASAVASTPAVSTANTARADLRSKHSPAPAIGIASTTTRKFAGCSMVSP